jgi:hypothetical protein
MFLIPDSATEEKSEGIPRPKKSILEQIQQLEQSVIEKSKELFKGFQILHSNVK